MLITNKMIEDFLNSHYACSNDFNKSFQKTKENLKQKGYEIEEPKTKLEIAREYREDVKLFGFKRYGQQIEVVDYKYYIDTVNAYEEAIQEILDKQEPNAYEIASNIIEANKKWGGTIWVY